MGVSEKWQNFHFGVEYPFNEDPPRRGADSSTGKVGLFKVGYVFGYFEILSNLLASYLNKFRLLHYKTSKLIVCSTMLTIIIEQVVMKCQLHREKTKKQIK